MTNSTSLLVNEPTTLQINSLAEKACREKARRSLLSFASYTDPAFIQSSFHTTYYKILDLFAKGKIKKLMVTVPPQTGKSEGSSRKLPAYLFGLNPDLKIAIASYGQTFVRKFSRDVKRILLDKKYKNLFPNTRYPEVGEGFSRTLDEWEIANYKGSLRSVGRGGPLTGSQVDFMLMDDLYKDYMEGNSPLIRANVIDWYVTVVRTRLHNDSQQLVVFTRWHERDLVGFLEKEEGPIVIIESWEQLENPDPDKWYKINFEALKTGEPTGIDPREEGEALWPARHSIKKLKSEQALDKEKFSSLYQGDPKSKAGRLYRGFGVYDHLPKHCKIKRSYCDVADTGTDKLCNIIYSVGGDKLIYVTDVYYTAESMEVTEPGTAARLDKHNVSVAWFESNNGGRGFSRAVKRILRETHSKSNIVIKAFHQSDNKEARIISNSANVQSYILFPAKWRSLFSEFAEDLLSFKKNFRANAHDDSADTVTGVFEKSESSVGSGNSLWEA